MTDSFENSFRNLRKWATEAQNQGWISDGEVKALKDIEEQSTEKIFTGRHRPLIVALFGGTGVGKSSLINRLAGETIAGVGVERPTSHEVTLYLHKEYQPDLLAAELPVEKTKIASHHHDLRRMVAWLDLPDIDSTAEENRSLVDNWLPFVDWLVYVVSPERYKDDAGWRYLKKRSHRHAWIFVMNHWDQGSDEQVEDFRGRLLEAGFSNPHILRTSCAEPYGDDDFHQLERLIHGAIKEYGLQLLQQLGIQARFDDLLSRVEKYKHTLGSRTAWDEADKDLQTTLSENIEKLANRMRLHVQRASREIPGGQTGPKDFLQKFRGQEQTQEGSLETGILTRTVWTKQCNTRLQNIDTLLLNQLQSHDLPYEPLKRKFFQKAEKKELTGEELVLNSLEDGLASALINPGTPLLRFAYKTTGWLSWGLPLVSAVYVIYQALVGYQAGIRGNGEFFGINFAIHSLLLIILSWFVPWIAHFKLKPDRAAAACLGLKNGIAAAREKLNDYYRGLFKNVRKGWQQEKDGLETIETDIRSLRQSALNYPEEFVAPLSKN